MANENKGEIIIYQADDGSVRLDVKLEDKTVWLTIDQMCLLYGKSRSTINEHILNIFNEGELEEATSVRKIGISDFSTKPTNFYNLDVIISVGYRVKSIIGTRFRQWATQRLHEYIVKGFALDDERLKGQGGGTYWKEINDAQGLSATDRQSQNGRCEQLPLLCHRSRCQSSAHMEIGRNGCRPRDGMEQRR